MIHPTSDVQSKTIGKNTNVWQFSVVLEKAKIGDNCNICSHCFIENDVVIGDNVTVKCGVHVWDGIRIEDRVQVGPSVVFTNDLYPRAKNKNFEVKYTLIKKGASLGANSTILPGIVIGEFASIGAGAVVTKDVEPHEIIVGNPSRKIGYACECGVRLDNTSGNKYKCSDCGKEYTLG